MTLAALWLLLGMALLFFGLTLVPVRGGGDLVKVLYVVGLAAIFLVSVVYGWRAVAQRVRHRPR